jgi:hypothetical protein
MAAVFRLEDVPKVFGHFRDDLAFGNSRLLVSQFGGRRFVLPGGAGGQRNDEGKSDQSALATNGSARETR